MGLEKLISDAVEQEKVKKSQAEKEHKALDKKSEKLSDIVKRIEVIEKFLFGGDK